MTRAELWRVMTGQRSVARADRMQWGSDNEFRAVAAVECHQGLIYSNTGKARISHFRDADGYKLRATPSGVYTHQTGDIGLLEAKCPQNLHEQLRPYIMAQVQFQAYVAWASLGTPPHSECDIAVCEWTFNGTRAWHVKPSAEYIVAALPLVGEFVGYVRDGKEPPRRKAPIMPDCETTLLFEDERLDIPF